MVKDGYKQTEVGVIPEDWGISSLRDITESRFTYGVNAPAVSYSPPLPNYIRITDISDEGYFIKENRTSVKCQDSEMYTLKENDIVFARTGASTGKTYLYKKSDGTLVYAGFLIKASIHSEKANSKYVFDCLHTQRYWDWVAVTSMRSGQPGINGNEYASFIIPCPPLLEQECIAKALSDVDNLIISLEKLLTKKKAIKQGTMQKLLTGKKRLLGFSGEWETVPFKDIYSFAKEGGTPSTGNSLYYRNGCIPFVKIEHLTNKYIEFGEEFITEEGLNHSSAWLIPINSIIFSNGATIGEISINKISVSTKQGILGIIPNASLSTEFLYYCFSNKQFLDSVKKVTTHGTMDVAYLKDLNSIELTIPKSKEEQTAIASILSDMDSEIEALEEKLEKTRQVKQGMMQELLTGRIRLV